MKPNIKRRNVNGVLLLDKPIGITSNEALQTVKRLYNANKAGHTGSLDPLASGMLPICFGEATKFSQYLLEIDKHYVVTGKLGVSTASGDTNSEIIATKAVPPLTTKIIQTAMDKFHGTTLQTPPMYAAIKHQGVPLYKLARQGITIERTPREITIYELKLVNFTADTITLEVHCSKGTYIRTLIADIGSELGCGAHAIELRRLSVGNYPEAAMIPLAKLQQLATSEHAEIELDNYLLPIDSMLNNIPTISLNDDMLYYLRQGNSVLLPNGGTPGLVKLLSKTGVFIGLGRFSADGKVEPHRLIGTS